MINISALRWGKPYESLESETIVHFATGEPIATVMLASPEAYDRVAAAATAAFRTWRDVPAPKRGDVVRDLGQALRDMKEPLGDLVSLEMGKIRAEGHGGESGGS